MRLFVAVNPPAQERRAIHQATVALRALDVPVKWASEENLHITLRFLGEVPAEQAGALGDALAAAVKRVKAFDVTLGGAGAFPDVEQPRVLWIGVERHPALELLANDIEKAIRPFGFEPELRPFSPHLTLGRVRKEARRGALKALEEPLREVDYSGSIVVDAIHLMISEAGQGGPNYRSLRAADLEGN